MAGRMRHSGVVRAAPGADPINAVHPATNGPAASGTVEAKAKAAWRADWRVLPKFSACSARHTLALGEGKETGRPPDQSED